MEGIKAKILKRLVLFLWQNPEVYSFFLDESSTTIDLTVCETKYDCDYDQCCYHYAADYPGYCVPEFYCLNTSSSSTEESTTTESTTTEPPTTTYIG